VKVENFLETAESLWPARLAEDWDRPGLSIGSSKAPLERVLLSVDFTQEVLAEAISVSAQLIFTHHPFLLRGVSAVSEDTRKGDLIAKAVRAGVAVFSAHTNADVVKDGVSDVLAKALDLENVRPLVTTESGIGHGRLGQLPAGSTIWSLVASLNSKLPPTVRGVSSTAAGELSVSRVALCGGAGDSFIEAAVAEGADVFVTSDLRHHVAQEAALPLIDVSHWASESLWLETAANQLRSHMSQIEFVVSSVNTDPWIFNKGSKTQ